MLRCDRIPVMLTWFRQPSISDSGKPLIYAILIRFYGETSNTVP
jgi:hypothetical protein